MTAHADGVSGSGLSLAEQREFEQQMRAAGIELLDAHRITRRSRESHEPLSYGQERLWLIDQLDPGRATYNVATAVRMTGPLDLPALRHSINEHVRRHEVLRSTIDLDPETGAPAQRVGDPVTVPVAVTDVSELTDAGWRQFAVERAREPFDLATGPLLRVHLLRHGPLAHTLLLTLHHIVFDGWSIGVMVDELAHLYAAYRGGRPPSLPQLPCQYADFARWQRDWLTGDRVEHQLAYWRAHLADLPPLVLPSEQPRPATRSSAGAQYAFQFPASRRLALARLCQNEGVTPFMALMAAFQAVLSQRSGQHDFGVGTPVAGRVRPELENLVGFFVNTLVLRADLTGGPTFRELLHRVRGTALSAWDNQDVPFERIVQDSGVQGDLTGTPLIQAMFALQNASSDPVRLADVDVAVEPVDTGASMLDLVLTMEEIHRGLDGLLTYRTDMFTEADATRFVDHLHQVLARALDNPDLPLAELGEPTGDERATLLRFGNWPTEQRRAPLPGVVELIQRRTDSTPNALAVDSGDGRLTYGALDARANQLARHLQRHGGGPDAVVALCLDRTEQLVVAVLAVLKAGAAYLPLDPEHPPERIAALVADGGARLLVTEARHLQRLPQGRWIDVCPDRDRGQISQWSADTVEPSAEGANLACVRYTSGSTGRPKGVAVTRDNLAHLVAAAAAGIGIGPTSRFLARSNVAFDAADTELLVTLCSGGTVVMADADQARDPQALARMISDGTCTHVQATPSLWRSVVEEGLSAGPGTTLLTVGEALSNELAAQLTGSGARVLNLYGPTETTVYATEAVVYGAERQGPSIGSPFGDTFLAVLDAQMRLVRQGVVGELYIGGPGVTRGYVGRPGETARRFVPDPYASAPGARLYATGDRVRWRDTGVLEFLGRFDDQVKIRGVRTEPGEIRAVLAAHPMVADAAVVTSGEGPDTSLQAYVVPAPGTTLDVATLREHAARHLPRQLVPGAFVEIPRLPLTPTGKLNRAALPPSPAAPATPTGRAPTGPEEQLLATLWADILGVRAVGADDDFFALGGHSLLAARLAARIRQTFGVELPLRAVFEWPSLAQMAAAIKAAGVPRASTEAIPGADRTKALPLSFAQERLWFLDRLKPGSPAYNIPVAVVLRGVLRVDALRDALDELVRRHEALRTTIVRHAETGLPVQRVHSLRPVDLDVVDVPVAERHGYAATEAVRPFDLAAGPLLRVTLLRHSPREHTLVVTVHHIVVDAWSIAVMVDDLTELYASRCQGRSSALPEVRLQYADYAAWQRAELSGDQLDEQLAYWRRQLHDLPTLILPTDHPRPTTASHRGETVSFTVPAARAAEWGKLCRDEGVTLFMALLAVFQTVLWQCSGQRDFAVGTPVAGRGRPELDAMVGFFVNTLVLRAYLSGDPTTRDLLARVRDVTLDAFEHQDVPFERVVEELRPGRSLDRTPLFQVMFGVQNAPASAVVLQDLEVVAEPVDTGAAKFDLAFYFRETPDGIKADLTYATDLFARRTVEALIAHFTRLLDVALADPDLPLSALPGPAGALAPTDGMTAEPVATTRRMDPPPVTGSAVERLFAAAMASALGVDHLAPDEDFFRLGGHSLLAMRVLAQLEDALGVEVPVRRFFESPTAAACARVALELAGDPAQLEQRAALVLEVLLLPDDEVVRMLDSKRSGEAADGGPDA